MALSQVELRKNLNEALLKRSAKAHHSAPGNIGPLGLPPTQQQGGPGPGVGPGLGGPPQLPVRERGSSTTDVPSYHSPVLSPYQSTSPATSPAGSTPPSPSLPPLLPPRDFPLNPTTTTPTINVNGLAAAAAGASPLRRPPVMLQHAATAHSPMIRSTGSLPLGAIAGGTGSPLRGSAIITNHHTGSDNAVLLTRAHSVVGAVGHRRSVSDDVEPAGERRDSGNWIHKRSLSSLVPRLGEMPTDPSLFEKVIIHPHQPQLRSCAVNSGFELN